MPPFEVGASVLKKNLSLQSGDAFLFLSHAQLELHNPNPKHHGISDDRNSFSFV